MAEYALFNPLNFKRRNHFLAFPIAFISDRQQPFLTGVAAHAPSKFRCLYSTHISDPFVPLKLIHQCCVHKQQQTVSITNSLHRLETHRHTRLMEKKHLPPKLTTKPSHLHLIASFHGLACLQTWSGVTNPTGLWCEFQENTEIFRPV